MKKLVSIILFMLFMFSLNASEYYPRLVGLNKDGERVMKGTCVAYPLNEYLDIMRSKEKLLVKYYPQEEYNYLKFHVMGQRGDDDFYFENIELKESEKEHLKDPKILKRCLTKLNYVLYKDRKALMDEKLFDDTGELEDFIQVTSALIGILETFSANDCTQVTWIAKLY